MGWSNSRAGSRPVRQIDVILKDGTYHHFTPRVLDVLLETNRVQSFKRDSGWATVGVDPVRKHRPCPATNSYHGPERRTDIH